MNRCRLTNIVMAVLLFLALAWGATANAQTAQDVAAACAATSAMFYELSDDADEKKVARMVREYYKTRSTDRLIVLAAMFVGQSVADGSTSIHDLRMATLNCWAAGPGK